ncbi:hypothetical protein AB1N83_012340 [Pleurotus pulmonarius]
MSFWIDDKDKGITTEYWVYLEEVSLDFDSSWTRSDVEICKEDRMWGRREVVKWCRRWVGPRSLEWVPSTDCVVVDVEDIVVWYGEGDEAEGPSHTSIIAGWEDVKARAQGAEYQNGIARLEIKRDFRLGASTVRLIVRKVSEYYRPLMFKLSVVIEDICRDEWNTLLEYQQSFKNRYIDSIVSDLLFAWRGNERVIEQTPESPWQFDPGDVTDNLRHVAHESLPLVLKYRNV